MTNYKKYILRNFIFIFFIIIFTVSVLFAMDYFNLIPKEYYKASHFNIKTIYSSVDYDNDKVDDYSDFVLGARNYVSKRPKYVSKYYDNSYPPDTEGVCTDVVWQAFKNAGYSLRDMVDNDIQNNSDDYPDVTTRDINIDFRRVRNLKVFFNKYAISFTLDPHEVEDWQPGDIVIFNDEHIGIISDRRNKNGINYVIHNYGQPKLEEDFLTKSKITGHYRFDASKIEDDILIKWQD